MATKEELIEKILIEFEMNFLEAREIGFDKLLKRILLKYLPETKPSGNQNNEGQYCWDVTKHKKGCKCKLSQHFIL